jgi:hypothetical protein
MALSLHAETGSLVIHLMLHAIGEERYEIASSSTVAGAPSTWAGTLDR